MPAWQKVNIPAGGHFVGWGKRKGQFVEGKVIDYDPAGGSDFNGKPCPTLEVELTKPAASFNKALDRTDFAPGENVVITCGIYELRRGIPAAEPAAGDMIRVEFDGEEDIGSGQSIKRFSIQIAHGDGKKDKPNVRVVKSLDDESAPAAEAADDDEPPF